MHQIQIYIDGEWHPFYGMGLGLEKNCERYRQIRTALRKKGIVYPCRLVGVSSLEEMGVLGARMYENQMSYPEIGDLFTNKSDISL